MPGIAAPASRMDPELADDTYLRNLTARAARQGMTTTTLASAAGLPTQDVARILDGTHTPCARARQMLARAVGTTTEALTAEHP